MQVEECSKKIDALPEKKSGIMGSRCEKPSQREDEARVREWPISSVTGLRFLFRRKNKEEEEIKSSIRVSC